MYTDVHRHGTLMYMSPSDRRPRIANDLAEKIDILREEYEMPFERYIHRVLEKHVAHNLGTPDETYKAERHGERRHTFTDPEGAVLYVDRDDGENHTHEGIIATLVVSDENYEAVGVYLDEAELRALRDVCTELLGEWEGHR